MSKRYRRDGNPSDLTRRDKKIGRHVVYTAVCKAGIAQLLHSPLHRRLCTGPALLEVERGGDPPLRSCGGGAAGIFRDGAGESPVQYPGSTMFGINILKKDKEGIETNTLLEFTYPISTHWRLTQPHGVARNQLSTHLNESILGSACPAVTQGTNCQLAKLRTTREASRYTSRSKFSVGTRSFY
jgi:hypothetical protein